MTRSLAEKLATLDPTRRAAVETEADRLHAEVLTLRTPSIESAPRA